MPNLEIVTTDQDIAAMTVWWRPGEEAFVRQVETGGVKSTHLLQKPEAMQLIAALSAFVAGQDDYGSDCALHSSPAPTIAACERCGSTTIYNNKCMSCGWEQIYCSPVSSHHTTNGGNDDGLGR